MTEATAEVAATEEATAKAGAQEADERLAYRGIFQRILVRPEIGAVLFAVFLWVFFWATSVPFGTASGASSILDVASSPLGIMAVAVAMLMIGGEFDLSSGAATGALGIVTILLVRDVAGGAAGAGLSLWVALPLSLLFALGLGWFNGTVVNRTGLPSFIVTLGSFFVLKGAKLGFSKLIVEQIQVGSMSDLASYAEANDASDKGYGFLNRVFADEWDRRNHIWDGRDLPYQVLGFVAMGLVVLGLYELTQKLRENSDDRSASFFLGGLTAATFGAMLYGFGSATRVNVVDPAAFKSLTDNMVGIFASGLDSLDPEVATVTTSSPGFIIVGGLLFIGGLAAAAFGLMKSKFNYGYLGFLVGVAVMSAGVYRLHQTDSVSGNFQGGALIGIGALIGMVMWGLGRFERQPLGQLKFSPSALGAFGAGAGFLAVGVLAARAIDADNSETIGWTYLATVQGMRAIILISCLMAATALVFIGVARARRESSLGASTLLAVISVMVLGVAFFIRSESVDAKFRTQAFSALLILAAIVFAWAVTSALFAQRDRPGRDALGNALGLAGFGFAVFSLIARLLYTTPFEIQDGITKTGYSVRILWFAVFTLVCTWLLTRTKFGSWTFAVGGNKTASRQVGVPADRTKTQLFMLVSFAAWLVGVLLAFRLNTIQASTGDGEEFEYIIAAVVGGTALTGGRGSTIGAAIGALIMAMSVQGIPSSRWNSDWRFVFIGAILLLAAIANNFIRERAEAAR